MERERYHPPGAALEGEDTTRCFQSLGVPVWSGYPGRGPGWAMEGQGWGEAGLHRSIPPGPFPGAAWLGGFLLLWFPGGNINGRAGRWHVHGEHVHPHLQATLQGWRGAVSSPCPSCPPTHPAMFPSPAPLALQHQSGHARCGAGPAALNPTRCVTSPSPPPAEASLCTV